MIAFTKILSTRRVSAKERHITGGFTLLEFVLVLFIMGALAAALAPSVRDIVERNQR